MTCQICGGTMRQKFQVNEFNILVCDTCAHQSTELPLQENHVARVYDDSYFFGGGAGYDDYLAESELLINHGKRYASLLSRYTKPGRVFDVGAAAGFVLKGFVDDGWNGVGIEPNARMAEHARSNLGLSVEVGSLETFETEERFDLITMIQVIGHFVDVANAFQIASNHMAPGGFLLVESWDRESWTARLFGKRWHEYSPPSVLHWFSKDGLKRLGTRNGLDEIVSGRPSKWLNGAHARSLLTHKLESSRVGRLFSVVTRLIPSRLPIPYPSEDLFWMLFQKG
jgi:SAM-dependent methyltransferase